MTEHKITNTITVIDDGTCEYNPENLEVRVGKELYDWKDAPKDALVTVVESGVIQELKNIAEAEEELNDYESLENQEFNKMEAELVEEPESLRAKAHKKTDWVKPGKELAEKRRVAERGITVQDKQVMELTAEDIIKYICPDANEREAYTFLKLCQARNLNPFTGEAHLIKYGRSANPQMVVGKEAFTRRAENNEKFKGFEAGIIVRAKGEKEIERREGSFYIYGEEELLGGWAKVWIDGREDHPFVSEVTITEYIGKKKDGSITSMWKGKPATMIRKDALVQALREALPSELGGMYDEAEINPEEDD